MADIKQAAVWMQEGKSVTRLNVPWSFSIEDAPDLRACVKIDQDEDGDDDAWFSIEDLLANDWEIAP